MGNSPRADITKMKAEMTRESAHALKRQHPNHVNAAEPSQELNVLSDARYARGNMTVDVFLLHKKSLWCRA
jgi:hypothetical protein